MPELSVSGAFIEWARRADNVVTIEPDGAVMVANPGGEIRFVIRPEGQLVHLFRAERSGSDKSVLIATSISDVEKYLAAVLGQTVVREREGLPEIWLPWELGRGAEDIRVESTADGRVSVHGGEGGRVEFEPVDPYVAQPSVEFSYLVGHPLRDIITSFSAPDGDPLFGRFVQQAS